jgi:isopenicillin N synthase-like dioxygenase
MKVSNQNLSRRFILDIPSRTHARSALFEVDASYDGRVTTTLPVIDVAPLRVMDDPTALRRVADAIAAAGRTFGFFYAQGHGIADTLFDRLEATSHAFFRLPEREEAAIAMAKGGIAWRGWFPLGGELTSGLPDRKEGLYLGEELRPDDPRVRLAGRCTAPICGPSICPSCGARWTNISPRRLRRPRR